MSDDVFTDPGDAESPDDPDGSDDLNEEWVDVRMTEPEEGEWNIDAVVVGGRVEYVDLQIRPDLLGGFVKCLLDDVSAAEARSILADVADGQNLNVSDEGSNE